MTATSTMQAAALEYAERDWYVFPCHLIDGGRCSCGSADCTSPGKHPRTARGFKDASIDPKQIRSWWVRWPEANIGIATGAVSGFIVLDVDGPAGKESLAALELEHGELPETVAANTGGGGRHLLFRHPGHDVANKTGILPGLDVRGDGGYILVEPSNHISGNTYRWQDGRGPGDVLVADCPEWLLQVMTGPPAAKEQEQHHQPGTNGQRTATATEKLLRAAALYVASVPGVNGPVGDDKGSRNAAGFSLAGHLHAFQTDTGETLSTSQVLTLMHSWNLRNNPPLSEVELADLARKGGMNGTPRAPHVVETQAKTAGTDRTAWADKSHYTDLGNAQRLVERYGAELRFTQGQGWLVYDGCRWKPDATGEAHRLAMRRVRELYAEAAEMPDDARKAFVKHALDSEGARRIGAMLELARRFEGVAIEDSDLDRNPWLFNTSSGTIEIDKASGEWEHRPHKRPDLITKVAPVEYSADAVCPTFERFITDIFLHDADMVAFAQRALGSCLVGNPEEVLHVLYGGGENGKSTLVNAVCHVLGGYTTTMPQQFLKQKFGNEGTHELMSLRGARLAIIHEPDARMVLDESKVKYLSGKDVITGRRLYHESVSFVPTHTLFLVTNHKPQVRSQTRAIWRRITLWPFEWTVPPESKDRNLGERLQAEAPGILNWLLAGLSEWVMAGHTCDPPAIVQDATRAYKRDEDILGEWFATSIDEKPGAETAFSNLYVSYQEWARAAGFEKLLSKRKLAAGLDERGFKRRILDGNIWFQGIQRRR